MSYQIVESCVNCWACEPICPSQAIYPSKTHFKINHQTCTECEGYFAEPQCASICPIEGAILNPFGEQVNPPGSLTGISPGRMAQVMLEIQAR